MKPFALYLHIPFCLQKCPYCDFNTYAVTSVPEREYVEALLCEADYRATRSEWRHRSIGSIYFGGGTPSLLSPAAIRKIITTIVRLFPVEDDVEISLEANPGATTEDLLAGFREAGVNRLSFGAQSFTPAILKQLGRLHIPEQIESGVLGARKAGIRNISLDLMYGVPSQTLNDVKHDLAAALRLDPEHVSAYGLTIEKGTPYFVSFKKGDLKVPKEDDVIEMMAELNGTLDLCGLHRYEISNFAKPGHEARHNLAYWNGDDYLGLGAGAHSFNRSVPSRESTGEMRVCRLRWANFGVPARYIQECTSQGHAESWREELSAEDAIFEFFFLGLRKIAGVSLREFRELFGCGVEEIYPARLEILQDQGLISIERERLALSPRGLMLADSVIEEFSHLERQLSEHVKAPITLSEAVPESVEYPTAVHE